MPWETGSADGKYQYYPGGDKSAQVKDAPSAVNVVVIPDVNLPKVRTIPTQGGEAASVPGLGGASRASPRDMYSTDLWTTTGAAREVQQVGQGRLLDDCCLITRLSDYERRDAARAESAFRGQCLDRPFSIGDEFTAIFSLRALRVCSIFSCLPSVEGPGILHGPRGPVRPPGVHYQAHSQD